MRLFGAIAIAVAAVAAPATAQDDILSKIINDPGAPEVTGAKTSVRDDPAVQGGKALRVQVPKKGANAWDVSLRSPINKPVKAGDKLLLAFWARLDKGENGATSASLPYNAVQLAQAPYTGVFTDGVTIGPEWKMYEVKGQADKDYAAGTLNATIHLATGKQVVDLGPVFVLNLGK